MNEEAALESFEEPAEERGRRRGWRLLSGAAKWAVGLIVAVLVFGAAFLAFLDTDAGHRFLADRIAALAPHSGLRIRIGRIEGSIWGRTRLRDVRLSDPKGVFAESPRLDVEWRPLAWISNRLVIDDATSDLVILHRAPKLVPSEKPSPILPGFDVRIGHLRIAQLRLDPPIAGTRRVAAVEGEADIRSGRALVRLNGEVRGGGDKLRLLLDAEPDRNRFDLDLRLDAPANSVAGALVGTKQPFSLTVDGNGSWSAWAGRATLDLAGARTAAFLLNANNGAYRLRGRVGTQRLLKGKLARLTAPLLLVDARSTLRDRRLQGTLSLRSASLKVETRGTIDLARSSFAGVAVGVDLLRPASLFPNMTGERVRLALLLNGPFSRAQFAYRMTSPRVGFDKTGFEDVRAEGRGRLSAAPVSVPILLTARRVTGVGTVAGGILANLRVQGVLKVTSKQLSGEGLTLSSDKLRGKLSLLVDLATGRFDVVISGGLSRYFIPGLGIVDVLTELKVVPGPGGHGSLVTGHGRAWVRRLDNKFLAGLAGGLPQIDTQLMRGSDGIVHFTNLKLTAPSIRIVGNGYRRRDGTFFFEGSGVQAQYGAFQLNLDGQIERPKLAIRLARPNQAMGLANVLLNLDPTPQGYAYRAEGMSALGPFNSRGAILLPRGQAALIQVAALNVSGTSATGALRSDPGGFTGRLDIRGGGLEGQLLFNPVANVQRIEAHLVANEAKFAGPPPIVIRRGKLDGVILLNPGGTSVEGSFSARGITRGGLSIASIDGQASMRGGTGRIRANVSGNRGRDFVLRLVGEIAPGQVRLSAAGTVDRRPIELKEPALFTRQGDAWRLSPTALSFAGGSATVSGLFGPNDTAFNARMESMPLTVLDIFYPRLGLGGIASGSLSYRSPLGGAEPSGDVNLRVRGLTRSGLVLSSRPVDIGIAAKLVGGNAAMRAIAVSEGRVIGRAQARIAPIGRVGDIGDRLTSAPLFAQLRYNGPADTLWRLTGIELLDLSGPVAVGADATGTLSNPQIRGSVKTQQARLESAVTGTVIENIQASGRFGGSRLVLDSFTGSTKRNGRVSGRGVFDLSATRGTGIDLSLDAQAAQLIDRDDIKAQVTGPLTIRSSGSGGTIAGNVRLVSGSFKLGSATAATQVARIPVREVNRPEDELPPPVASNPWTLDLKVHAPNRLTVTGLGINSEWSADLRIAGTVGDPRISGRAELVRGSYDFAGRRFDLERGTIQFLGETPVNPSLDIVARGNVQGINAEIHVTGRGQQPEIAFTSVPALPQDELLSRLLFGTSITNLSAPEALQLAAAVASLNSRSGSLDPINAVRAATGLDRLRILPADIATGQGTAIAAGKYIGRRVYVEVITDAHGYSATRLEYQITRWLSLLSSISTIGRQSVNVRISKDY